MTTIAIKLSLAEDTTKGRCGACPYMGNLGRCILFKKFLRGSPKSRVRLPECIAAQVEEIQEVPCD